MDRFIEVIKEIAFFSINLYKLLIYKICTILPIVENKIFVNCFDGKGYGDNPKYILMELMKYNKDIKVYWLCKENILSELSHIKYVKPFSIQSIYHQATSKIWISTVRMPFYSCKRKNQKYIQTWHGSLAYKKIENECENALSSRYIRTAKHDSTMIDYFISSNRDNTNTYLKYFWYKKGEVLEVGTPRNDIFFNLKEVDINYLRKKYDVDGKKVVVYAPTFRKDGSFNEYKIDFYMLLDALTKKFGGDWIVYIRLHPRLTKKSKSFIKYTDKIMNASYISDVQELLAVADLLITDYSSIIFDFINTDRPAFIYASDIESYANDRDFHMRLEETPFLIAKNNQELVTNILEYDDEVYKKLINNFKRNYGFRECGEASKKVAILINDLLRG